jgi:multicomponent K+:H+ antiporter subunit A
MRGHNEPGGGFVAGLVLAIAFIAQYIVQRHAMGRVAHAPAARTRWIATGLLIALATGLGSLRWATPS